MFYKINLGSALILFIAIILFNKAVAQTWSRKTNILNNTSTNMSFSANGKGYLLVRLSNNFFEYNSSTNTWTAKAAFPGAFREIAACFSIGDKGYVCTGVQSNGTQLSDLWEYNTINNTWTQKASFPGGERYATVGLSIGNRGYVGMGFDGSLGSLKNDFWEYNPTANSWTQRADFGAGVRAFAAGFSIGIKGYVGTGASSLDNTGLQNDFWEYDPGLNLWSQKINFPGTSRAYALGFSLGTKGYLGTGSGDLEGGPGPYYHDFWEYNPSNNSWTSKPDYPGAGSFYLIGFSIGTRGYVGGGEGGNFFSDFWQFSNSVGYGGSWVVKGTSPSQRRGEAAATANGIIYVVGGAPPNSTGSVATAEAYNPATNTWTTLPSLPIGSQQLVAQAINGIVYAVAGGGCCGAYSNVQAYDPGTNSWTLKTSAPTARYGATSAVINNKMYVMSGGSGYGALYQTLEMYDPITNAWTTKASMPLFRGGCAATAVNGIIYAIGGGDASGTFFGTVQAYDPLTDAWSIKSDMPTPRGGLTVAALNNKIYAIGGNNNISGDIGIVEIYDPATDTWSAGLPLTTLLTSLSSASVNGKIYAIGDIPPSYPASPVLTVEEFTACNNTFSSTTVTACDQYLWNGVNYTTSGDKTFTTTNVAGCDSVATLHLAIHYSTSSSFDTTICNSYTLPWGGTVYTSGAFLNTYQTINGCDSVVTANVVINNCTHRFYVNDNNVGGDVFTTSVGNNINPGTAAAPYATLDYALTQIQAGDSIYVDRGDYPMSNFTIDKPLTLLGINYNLVPNDPIDPFQSNSARINESKIIGPTITIGSSNITIKGLRLIPTGKTAIVMSTSGISNLVMEKNKIDIASGFVGIQLSGGSSNPLVSSNYQFIQNRFEAQDTLNTNIGLRFGGLKNVLIDDNSFIGKQKTNRVRFSTGIGAINFFNDSVIISNNYFDTLSQALLLPPTSNAIISNNQFRNVDLALTANAWPGNMSISNVQILQNHFSKVRSNGLIFFRQLDPNFLAMDNLIIKDNFIELDVTLPVSHNYSMIQVLYQGGGSYGLTRIENNKINISGDYGTTPGNYGGIQIGGKHSNTIISGNEISFAATNEKSTPGLNTFPTSNTGIYIQTDNGSGFPNIPSTANISVQNNKVNGFKTSIAFYDPSNNAASPFLGYGNLASGVTVGINNNSLINDSISINNGAASQIVNANCNWYGMAKADNIIQKVTASTVNYIPWLSDGTDAQPAVTGFQPIAGTCNGTPVVISFNASNNLTCFEANNGSIDVNVSGGILPYIFVWTRQGDPIFVNPTTEDIANLQQGTYKLIVTDAVGSKDSITSTITQPAAITFSAQVVNVICPGQSNGSITINASEGIAPYQYSLNSGTYQSSNFFGNLAEGNYLINVKDANGCIKSNNVVVAAISDLHMTAVITNVACFGDNTGAINITVTGGSGNYIYRWAGAGGFKSTQEDISNLKNGTYTVVVTDATYGCTITQTYTVTQPTSALKVNATKSDIISCGTTGSVTATASGGMPAYQYKLNNGAYQSSGIFAGLATGTYTITAKDANGCIAIVIATIADTGNDDYEKNESKNQAKQINIGIIIFARISVASDAADWFKFTTPAGNGNYVLMLTHPSANFAFDIYPGGNNASSLTPQSSTSTTKTYTLNGNTTYYIGVIGGLSYVCYKLSVTNEIITKASGNVPIYEMVKTNEGSGFVVKVYPNPNNGIFHIDSEKGNYTISVYNTEGKLVSKKEIQAAGICRVDLSHLSNGMYMVDVKQGTSKKLIKVIKQ